MNRKLLYPLPYCLLKLSLTNSIVLYAFENISIMGKLHTPSYLFTSNSLFYRSKAERNRTTSINSINKPEYCEAFNIKKLLSRPKNTLRTPN